MRSPTGPQLLLIGLFLVIITGVPISQAIIELRRGEAPQAGDVVRHWPTAPGLRAYEHALEDSSVWAAAARPWSRFVQFALFRDGGEKASWGRDGWLFYRPGVDYLTAKRAVGTSEATVEDAVAAIVAFRDDLARYGAQLLVMPAPNKESIYPEMLSSRAPGPHPLRGPETRRLMGKLRAAGVELFDLFELFERTRAQGPTHPRLYLVQDSHWSPVGATVAAQAVAAHIRERNWVGLADTPYRTVSVRLERLGDILRMMQVPALERRLGPEPIDCQQVVLGDRQVPYQDDPNSEILVLGDSFLRIYQTDEPQAAGFIAQLARGLRRPLASIVNDGGASTLVRQDLLRRPALLAHKKLVIWEFVERDIRLGTEGWPVLRLPDPARIDR